MQKEQCNIKKRKKGIKTSALKHAVPSKQTAYADNRPLEYYKTTLKTVTFC